MPTLPPETYAEIARRLAAGGTVDDTAAAVGCCLATIRKIKMLRDHRKPVLLKPRPMPATPAPRRPRQIGERWSAEHNFTIRVFEPWHAEGDLAIHDAGCNEAE